MKKLLLLICTLTIIISATAQKVTLLTSPNGNMVFSFSLKNKMPEYAIAFKGKTVIASSLLSLQFDNGLFKTNLKLGPVVYKDTIENYDLPIGKTSHVTIKYNQVALPLEETVAPFRKVKLMVRAFDDGIAFRYEMIQQAGATTFNLLNETTTFNLAGDPMVHALLLPNYTTSHEGLYTHTPLSRLQPDTLMDMPALFEYANDTYVAITEAALLDYAGMYLIKHDNVLTSSLSPLPGQNIKVKGTWPHKSPWRVIMISDRVGAFIESNMITSLNEPNKLKDISWLKPGKTTFPWWNGNVLPDTINAPGNNFVTAKYYIDFCARNGLQYHSVVEYGLHQWYADDGIGFMPGPHADVTTAVPGLDMKEICDYAKTQNVGIRVWVHWAALYPKIDSAFAVFERWGLQGMMIDFMDRDDQQMVNIQTEMLEKAAAHHLHIQFHGAYKNTGLNRTYPNEFTREGTRNYETNKWGPEGLSPEADIDIPFTRMLAGSTDYHLGGFRAVPADKFKAQYTRPLQLGTRCHMLGMYVVLENYLQMVCDYPAAYEGQAGFEFIKEIPTTWDETKVVDAKVREYVCIARRKGDDWYVGAITNTSARELQLPLNFLPDGNYTATVYKDAADTNINADDLVKETMSVNNKLVLKAALAGGGGMVVQIKRTKQQQSSRLQPYPNNSKKLPPNFQPPLRP